MEELLYESDLRRANNRIGKLRAALNHLYMSADDHEGEAWVARYAMDALKADDDRFNPHSPDNL